MEPQKWGPPYPADLRRWRVSEKGGLESHTLTPAGYSTSPWSLGPVYPTDLGGSGAPGGGSYPLKCQSLYPSSCLPVLTSSLQEATMLSVLMEASTLTGLCKRMLGNTAVWPPMWQALSTETWSWWSRVSPGPQDGGNGLRGGT